MTYVKPHDDPTAIVSLDVGTTSLKGVLFDLRGNILAIELEEYDLSTPAPDIVECDPEFYWQAAQKVIRHLLLKSRIEPRDVRSVGVTSQGETLIVLDDAGHALRPAIVWLDNRSHVEAKEIERQFGVEEVYRVTGQPELTPTWTATKILWLQKHEPQVFRRAGKFLLVEDYLLFRLTGRYFSDDAMNASTLYFDIRNHCWWPEMLKFLAISADQLPELKYSGQFVCPISAQAAAATGLSPKTTVTSAPIDQIAGGIGAGNLAPGILSETTGAALGTCATCDGPIYDPAKAIPCQTHGVPGKYVLMAWAPTAGMALRWFRDVFGGGADYAALCADAELVAPGAEGLMFLPYLCGAGCPEMLPKAKGVFWGISLAHRKAHFTRAIIESIAFVLRRNVDHLETLVGSVAEVRCLGGGARSPLWLQIKADMLNRACAVMECEEATSLGVAMVSCVANGIYRDTTQAQENMVRIKNRVMPNPRNTGAMNDAYQRYLQLHNDVKNAF